MRRKLDEMLAMLLQEAIQREKQKPLVVAIMGQTGVGKSSLLNALLGTTLPTDAVRPCTRDVTFVKSSGPAGGELWFYDLPGIGEIGADDRYLALYREKLIESDIVLWAMHADVRSVAFDRKAFHILLEGFELPMRVALLSKVTLVLTKADLVFPSPWILAVLDAGDEAMFVPAEQTRVHLEQKAHYLWENLMLPYKDLVVSQAPFDGHFEMSYPGFTSDGKTVFYQGMFEAEQCRHLSTQFPHYARVFERLHNHHSAICCSSRFRYNLDQLLLSIIDKLPTSASLRLGNFLREGMLSRISVSEARHYGNLIVVDQTHEQVIFDLSKDLPLRSRCEGK